MVGYVLKLAKEMRFVHGASWYILQVKNDENATNVKGKEYENMHIGFFVPDTQLIRVNKLKELGI